MEFQEVVRRRRMVRNFEPRPLPQELLARILDNARRVPSAGYSQGFEFLVLEGTEQTGRFWEVEDPERGWEQQGWTGVYNAPALIVPLAHKLAYLDRYAEPDKAFAQKQDEAAWPAPYWLIDTGFATLMALLSAVDAGLGALFFGVREPARLRAAFAIPDSHQPIGTLALGYAAPDRPSGSLKRGRRPLESIVHRGSW